MRANPFWFDQSGERYWLQITFEGSSISQVRLTPICLGPDPYLGIQTDPLLITRQVGLLLLYQLIYSIIYWEPALLL